MNIPQQLMVSFLFEGTLLLWALLYTSDAYMQEFLYGHIPIYGLTSSVYILYGQIYCSHLTDQETEAQKSSAAGPESHH